MAYVILKFFHVLLAIVAVGANITYGAWFARAARDPQSALFALRGVKFIDDYIANPAYLLLLPTGIALVHAAGYNFAMKWISWAMGLWVVAIVIAYAVYAPTLRRQIEAVASGGVNGPAVNALATRGRIVAAVLAIIVIAILALMIAKPQ